MATSFKLIVIISIIIFPFHSSLKAQSMERYLLSNAGAQQEVENLKLEWSLGETVIAFLEGPVFTLSQGFHQGSELITFVDTPQPWSGKIYLYPNPAGLNLNIKKETNLHFTFKIMDFTGKLIDQGKIQENVHELDIHYFDEGLYVLLVSDAQKNFQAYKFIKQ